MQWSEYVDKLSRQETVLDTFSISLNIEEPPFVMPPIVKTSILLNDSIMKQGVVNKTILFPDVQTCAPVYMITRVLFDISENRIQKDYNPYSFVKGEKLKYKNCVMEFVCVDTDNEYDTELIWVRFVDGLQLGLPLNIAPHLQRTDSKLFSKYMWMGF